MFDSRPDFTLHIVHSIWSNAHMRGNYSKAPMWWTTWRDLMAGRFYEGIVDFLNVSFNTNRTVEILKHREPRQSREFVHSSSLWKLHYRLVTVSSPATRQILRPPWQRPLRDPFAADWNSRSILTQPLFEGSPGSTPSFPRLYGYTYNLHCSLRGVGGCRGWGVSVAFVLMHLRVLGTFFRGSTITLKNASNNHYEHSFGYFLTSISSLRVGSWPDGQTALDRA